MYTGEENGRCRLDPINLLKRKASTPITTPYCAEEKEKKNRDKKRKETDVVDDVVERQGARALDGIMST